MSNKITRKIKYLFLMIIMLNGHILFAHQPDLSVVVVSKTSDHKIVLQINSSLTAFQGEVKYHNSKNPYSTPEEFKELVIKHFLNTFSIVINEKDTLRFKNPMIILGHETKLIAEVLGIPEDVNSVSFKNDLFKDIHNSQSTIIFAIDGFPTNQYVLNKDNHHQINLLRQGEKWQKEELIKSIFTPMSLTLFSLSIIVLLLLARLIYKRMKAL